jgi:hypothetical protein
MRQKFRYAARPPTQHVEAEATMPARRPAALAVLLMSLTLTAPSHAATITETIDFTASNFQSNSAQILPPIDPLAGSFTFTFNPASPPLSPTATGFTLNSLNIANLSYPTRYEYDPGAFVELIVGSYDQSYTNGVSTTFGEVPGENSFFLEIANLNSSSPKLVEADYAIDGLQNVYFSTNTGSVDVVSRSVSAVPLPDALPMFGAATIAMGGFAASRSRRR